MINGVEGVVVIIGQTVQVIIICLPVQNATPMENYLKCMIKLEVSVAYSFKEFHEKMKDPEFRNFGRTKCSICHNYLDALDEQEPYYVNKKRVCSDCYYGEFGKPIDEQGGIGVPHKTVRGCSGDID